MTTPLSDLEFAKALSVGIRGWLLGMLGLFGLAWWFTKPETTSEAILWAIQYWWIAFIFGLLLLAIHTTRKKTPTARPALAYILPVALIACLAAICLAIYPETGFRNDLQTYLPIIGIFSLVGVIWIRLRKSKSASDTFARAVLPPIVGGIVLLGFVAVPVFRSPDFIYRNAFSLTASKMGVVGEATVVNAILEIRKAGDYEFTPTPYEYFDMPMMTQEYPAPVKRSIVWGTSGKPTPRAIGSFPLQIQWKTTELPAQPAHPAHANRLGMSYFVTLEVRTAADPQTVAYRVSTTLPESLVH